MSNSSLSGAVVRSHSCQKDLNDCDKCSCRLNLKTKTEFVWWQMCCSYIEITMAKWMLCIQVLKYSSLCFQKKTDVTPRVKNGSSMAI